MNTPDTCPVQERQVTDVEIGAWYIFEYPNYGFPDGHPEHTAHSGQALKIIRQLSNEECDPECQPSFIGRAKDGWEGTVHASELKQTTCQLK